MENTDNIKWKDVAEVLKKDIDVKKMELFGTLYNFLYKETGTDKAMYIEPVFEHFPEILSVLAKYFDLAIMVDKEDNSKVIFLKSKKIKNPKEYKKAKDTQN